MACDDTSAPGTDLGAEQDAVATDAGSGADEDVVQSRSVAEELGITQYSGTLDLPVLSSEGGVTTYEFDTEQGPMCLRGAPFRTAVRDVGSEDVVIFLQGGGACWSTFCLAVTGAPVGIPGIDILDPDAADNPVARWNHVYVPYCDGSFFAGDADIDDNVNDKGTRYHRGLANLTAAFEVARQTFPAPRRVLLAGSSGGAYGLLLGAPLARHYFPDAELIVMADSGIGLARDGDPAYLDVPLGEFNLTRFIPDDCEACTTSGHITALVSWYLARDENIRVGMYSSWYDSVLATTFLQVPKPDFARSLREQTDAVHAAYPDRFRRFVTDGTQHTALLGDPSGIIGSDLTAVELPPGALQDLLGGDLVIGAMATTTIGDVSVAAWLGGLIDDDSDAWPDLLETPTPVSEGSGE